MSSLVLDCDARLATYLVKNGIREQVGTACFEINLL